MSVIGLAPASRTAINPEDYDHAINLVDTTKPAAEHTPDGENADQPEPSEAPLSRKWTRSTLRGEIARRKYSKLQEDRYIDSDDAGRASVEDSHVGEQGDKGGGKPAGKSSGRASQLRNKIPFRSRRRTLQSKDDRDYIIDILYENQRGAFWCGIPLYSAKSLLNFDPAGWQTSSFLDSPVNITNAQVPDPTWRWVWKNWYVDMSHDVDEEGWEYSFSFQPSFAWHGSHPWFHSFVRRRRWLRKRIQVHPQKESKKDDMKAAHMLAAEYFTIHPKRDVSPDSTGIRTTADRSTYYSNTADQVDVDEGFQDTCDVNALTAALKKARIDREKVAAVMNFMENGGDELYYLAERMAHIMASFIYQTSRRQIHSLLLRALDEATMAVDESDKSQTQENELKTRKQENLLKAVQSAGIHINDEEYWSDIREKTTENEPPDAPIERQTLDATKPSGKPGQGPEIDEDAHIDIGDELRGIPDDAHTSEEPGIKWRKSTDSQSKGKERA